MRKPVYVLAESFKFVRLYPLNQRDLPNELKVLKISFISQRISFRINNLNILKFSPSVINANCNDLINEHPQVDYTPPGYLTLLFTDLGILTPSAVSDELIKLYL